jgi:pimeloyl-ACP methyl ester carboxylesterase
VSRIKVISGAGHWMQLEDPDAVASAVLEFLT